MSCNAGQRDHFEAFQKASSMLMRVLRRSMTIDRLMTKDFMGTVSEAACLIACQTPSGTAPSYCLTD